MESGPELIVLLVLRTLIINVRGDTTGNDKSDGNDNGGGGSTNGNDNADNQNGNQSSNDNIILNDNGDRNEGPGAGGGMCGVAMIGPLLTILLILRSWQEHRGRRRTREDRR